MTGGRPFREISDTDLGEAAVRKHALSLHANCAAVARTLGIPRRTLSDHLERNPDLRLRFRISKNSGYGFKTPELYRMYELAAAALKEEGDLPSPASLARYLEIRRPLVIQYLGAHRDLGKRIGLVCDKSARVWREGKAMIRDGIPVLRRDLAARSEIHYITLVNRILPANPTFYADLRIVRDLRYRR